MRGRSPAEYTGMVAIGLVVVAAWVYSITLEYAFFAAVTPGTNPMFPYLGLAFTGIGLALWGIGFACAHKAFTQVMTMIMMLASGGTAVYIATVQFQAQGDARYNIATDPANYTKALTIVGVMLLLNVAMLVLKIIVWRFSQIGTSFFVRPQVYPPTQQPQYHVSEAQPKEERILEQRAQSRQPVPQSSGPGFWESLVSKLRQPKDVPLSQGKSQEEMDDWLAEQQLRQEQQVKEEKQRKEAARSRVLARQQSQQLSPAELQEYARSIDPANGPIEDDKTPVQPQPLTVDRKAEAERAAKQPKK